MAKRTPATMQNIIVKALAQVKKLTSNPTPKVMSIHKELTGYSVPPKFLQTIIDHGFISAKRVGRGRNTEYQWIAGNLDKDEVALSKLYEAFTGIPLNLPKAVAVSVQTPKASQTVTRSYTPKKVEKNVVQMVPESKPRVKNVPKEKPVDKKALFADIKGTIFGYKQLQFMGKLFRDRPTTVVIDDRMHIENIKLITFSVKDSRLTIVMYSDVEKDILFDKETLQGNDKSRVSTIQLDNCVLALKEHGGDTEMCILKVTIVPINNPYEVM